MQKEEIFALIDQLTIDQSKFTKFHQHLIDFCSHPRCKKGCLEFVNELFNLTDLSGRDELALTLLSDKTNHNAYKTRWYVESHPITAGYIAALKQARCLILSKISDYIRQTSLALGESNLTDRAERQVYLRRAVARLQSVFYSSQRTVIETEQWSEVEPYQYTDYLLTDMDELLKLIDGSAIEYECSIWGDAYSLDRGPILLSLRSYILYLDTFLKF